MNAKSGKERDALIAAYREGLGLVAIVFLSEDREFRIAVDRGVAENAVERWWCRNAAEAERVASAANAGLRHKSANGVLDADGREAASRAAKRLNVVLRCNRDIAAEAIIVIDRIAVEFEQLRNTGSLRPVNKSYRDYRLEAAARGERIVPYAQWMRAYQQNLVRRAAATLRYL